MSARKNKKSFGYQRLHLIADLGNEAEFEQETAQKDLKIARTASFACTVQADCDTESAKMPKSPTKWSFPRRTSYGVLERFVGQEINVFGPRQDDEHDNCLGGGFLIALEDGFLLLAERPNEPPDLAVALSEVVVVAVIKDRPELTAVDGGKVHRLRRPESPSAPDVDDDEPNDT